MNFYPLIVSDIIEETSLAKSITFQLEDKYRSTFNYQAGQFLSLRLPWEDSFLDRSYSLSSSPNENSQLKITVKRVLDGRASNLLNDTSKESVILSTSHHPLAVLYQHLIINPSCCLQQEVVSHLSYPSSGTL